MREILFRGKRVDNGEWVEGNYIHRTKYYGDSDDAHFILTGGEFDCDFYDAFKVDPSTVGQYTGLTDKNGKKIFEGDILREPPRDNWEKRNYVGFEVFYHDNDACDSHVGWQMNRLHFYGALCGADIYPRSFRPIWTNRMEVIGNIYDNPELIGGEKR
jgi:uncharacterized phage protein (TIGR01671 family)